MEISPAQRAGYLIIRGSVPKGRRTPLVHVTKTNLTNLSPIDYNCSVTEKEIKKLELQNGLVPFDEWFDSLRDRKMQVAVDARLTRIRAGNFGDCKPVGGGVFELRLALGSGLRVYYGLRGQQVVILLGGGDKSTQTRDIRRAQQLWQQFTKHASEELQS